MLGGGRAAEAQAFPEIKPFSAARTFWHSPAAQQLAWLCWGVLILTIGLLVVFGAEHTVVGAYRDAAHQWFAGARRLQRHRAWISVPSFGRDPVRAVRRTPLAGFRDSVAAC